MSKRTCAIWSPLLLLLVGGCQAKTEPADTGARAVAQDYYDALLRRDWVRAYEALGPTHRSRRSLDQFSRQAQRYRQTLGFEPDEVHIRACEEHGEEAIVHVAWTGRQATRSRPHRDALVLRRGPAHWAVTLPRHFGESRNPATR